MTTLETRFCLRGVPLCAVVNEWLLLKALVGEKVPFGVCYLGLDCALLREDRIAVLTIEDGGVWFDIVAI